MPLRCLVFSSNEAMIQPFWQVLADLGVEGEYCASAVDAVERVTTQMFQIVITDWDDQPEAAFLLKTAKDLKAAYRPLTLAIVSDDSRLPEALKAGANSVLVKPIRAEQVRETMSTACELLRAKQQPAAPRTVAVVQAPEAGEKALGAAAAAPISRPSFLAPSIFAPSFPVPSSVPAVSAPSSVTQAPEKPFRAGEFLQPRTSAPGAQFDTEEKEIEVGQSVEQAGADKVEALTELEPMASAVEESPAKESQPESQSETQPESRPATQTETRSPLTGWASLQARLTRSAPAPAEEAPSKSELLSYGETSSSGAAEISSEADKTSGRQESPPQPQSKSEAALFAYMAGEPAESSELQPHSRRSRLFLLGILAAACVFVAAVPRGRQGVQTLVGSAVRTGARWLNPPPAPVPQSAPQHDSFSQSGDEYKLPVVANIPDATTDPSQIRVLPVIDPTAKPEKNADGNAVQGQAPDGDSSSSDQNNSGTGPSESGQSVSNNAGPSTGGESQSEESPAKDAPTPTVVERYAKTPAPLLATTAAQPKALSPVETQAQSVEPQQPRPSAPPARKPSPTHAVTLANNSGIPSSLKTQMASSTPDASGNKSPEAAMSSIEPVTLTESAARDLLMQPVEPEYPAGAKAGGQRGSVVLQVIIGRDGAVRDAKFLQGSLVFARSAIDAVKQWRFRPYSMNGRVVAVQSVITLNFKPPA